MAEAVPQEPAVRCCGAARVSPITALTFCGRNTELAADGVGERSADALSHLMAADANDDIALVGDPQMRDSGHDEARVGADRYAPADFSAVRRRAWNAAPWSASSTRSALRRGAGTRRHGVMRRVAR